MQELSKFQIFSDLNPPANPTAQPQVPRQIIALDNDRLPPLLIPDFDGDYKNWESFRDICTSTVINRPNTSVVKLRNLKSNVKGEALNLIQPFDITE